MRKLRDEKTTPPGGWRFVDPNTGFRFERSEFSSLAELVTRVDDYRAQNKLEPLPDTTALIMDFLCSHRLVAGRCTDAQPSRSVAQYLSGLRAMAQIATRPKNRAYVSQETADERAKICARCPKNQLNENHRSLGYYADRAVRRMVGNRATFLDGKLFSCAVCTCPLRSKVHVAQDIVEQALTQRERVRLPQGSPGTDGKPIYCWQVKPVKEEEAA